MNKEQAVGLAVRLFAIFLVVYTMRYATSVVAFSILEPPDYISSGLILLVGFSPILIAILLWRFPLTVASKLMPEVTAKEKSKSLSETELQVVAFSTLGLWVFVSAIPDIFYWATYTYRFKNVGSGNTELTPQNIGGMVATAAQIVLGFALLLGSKGLVGLVRRLRNAGN